MKALVLKEFRENLKIALVGLAILLFLVFAEYRNFSWSLKNGYLQQFSSQPLLFDGVIGIFTFFCAIFGTLLGWIQIHNERHRDLWAFLIHRPLTRTRIISGKVVGGLLLYLLMPGIPLFLCVVWIAIPGHVPAPFEWSMALPLLAAYLGGVAYYFAGMLGGLRRARWYGSRYLGLGLAILVSIAVQLSWAFPEALVYILAGAGILGTAAWGSFQSDGQYEGQPATGRACLAISLAAGAAFLVFLISIFAFEMIFRSTGEESWSKYAMAKNGAIYKVVAFDNGRSRVWRPAMDLNGKSVQATITNAAADHEEWQREESTFSQLGPNPYDDLRLKSGFQSTSRYFSVGGKTSSGFWYFWRRYSCLVCYDLNTRRLVGCLGPNGFSPSLPEANSARPAQLIWKMPDAMLSIGNDLYELNLDRRSTRKFFTSDDGDIIDAVHVLRNFEWKFTVALAEHSVLVLEPDGKVAWRYPLKHAAPVTVSYPEPPGEFAIWITDTQRTNAYAGHRAPTLVTWFGPQGAERNVELPPLELPRLDRQLREKVMAAVLPPVFWASVPIIRHQAWPETIAQVLLRISFIAALVCLPVAWWLGARYRFRLGAKVGWTVFILCCGIPGLLAFLSVQEWPARVSCPHCRKLRVVNREQCEHCQAAFAPPDKNGTEIFEAAGAR